MRYVILASALVLFILNGCGLPKHAEWDRGNKYQYLSENGNVLIIDKSKGIQYWTTHSGEHVSRESQIRNGLVVTPLVSQSIPRNKNPFSFRPNKDEIEERLREYTKRRQILMGKKWKVLNDPQLFESHVDEFIDIYYCSYNEQRNHKLAGIDHSE